MYLAAMTCKALHSIATACDVWDTLTAAHPLAPHCTVPLAPWLCPVLQAQELGEPQVEHPTTEGTGVAEAPTVAVACCPGQQQLLLAQMHKSQLLDRQFVWLKGVSLDVQVRGHAAAEGIYVDVSFPYMHLAIQPTSS